MQIQMELLSLVLSSHESNDARQMKKKNQENMSTFTHWFSHIGLGRWLEETGVFQRSCRLLVRHAWRGRRHSSEAGMSCDVNRCDSPVKACSRSLRDSFSCQFSRPTGRKTGVAPFRTTGAENADNHFHVRPIDRSDDPQRPGRLTFHYQVTGSLRITWPRAGNCNMKMLRGLKTQVDRCRRSVVGRHLSCCLL